MSRFLKVGEAAKILGVSIQTLRRWEEEGYLLPHHKSNGKTRYYSLDQLTQTSIPEHALTVAYARVSSHDQKEDLERQAHALEIYCVQKGWNFQVIKDLGSGMNYQKKGLKTLLTMILERKAARLVLTHKDRLLRFGAELIFALCEAKQIEVVIINKGDEVSFEAELAQDMLEIITVFSARLYRNNLKNRDFDKEGSQNLHAERGTIAEGQGPSENAHSEVNPTQSKTDFSSCLGIYGSRSKKNKKLIEAARVLIDE